MKINRWNRPCETTVATKSVIAHPTSPYFEMSRKFRTRPKTTEIDVDMAIMYDMLSL